MRRVLVTGGSGFLGQHIVPALVRGGHFVRVLDRFASAKEAAQCGSELCIGDLRDRDVLERALTAIDVIVHLACTTVPQTSEERRIDDVHSNIETTLLLLECAVRSGVRRFIFASSGGTVYGEPHILPIPEEHPAKPVCSHGVMKLAIENYLEIFRRLTGLDAIALRMANPYGPGQGIKLQGFIGVLLRRLKQGKPIEVWGNGSVVRDFVHVSDVATAFEYVVSGRGVSSVYNVGSSKGRSLLEVIAIAEKILSQKIPVKWLQGRPFDVPVNVLDISRARRELGWMPVMSLEDGLRNLIDMS